MVATALRARLTVQMPSLHTGQREVRDSAARFRVLACGRRWGKTMLGVVLCLAEALMGKRAWWVAPSYPIASIGWREIKRFAKQVPGAEIRETDRQALLPGGGWVQVKSADNPNSLRGEGLHFTVLDEAAYIAEEAWTEALRPALSDREGRALFISTPNGHNWFWRIWQQGEAQAGEWAAWQRPTASNPFIKATEIEAARLELPEQVFAQEYLAEFREDAAAVFRRVREAATATPQERAWVDPATQQPHAYCVGADWGQTKDFSVFSVLDLNTKQQVHQDRSNHVEYLLQVARLEALCAKFKPALIVAEANAMGTPILEHLTRKGLPVHRWTATNATKAEVIQDLALAFEQGVLRILNDATLIGELQAYSAERLPSGMVRYSAPEGMHDDCVMALALAWQGASLARTGAARTPYALGQRPEPRNKWTW